MRDYYWLFLGVGILAAVAVFGAIVVSIVTRHIDRMLIKVQTERYERSQAELDRLMSRSGHDQEFITEIRQVVAEFREVLEILGQMHPEGWDDRKDLIVRRLDSLDGRLAKQELAMTPA